MFGSFVRVIAIYPSFFANEVQRLEVVPYKGLTGKQSLHGHPTRYEEG